MTTGSPAAPARPPRTSRRCPICRAPAVAEWRPFCSKRCADADLGRWLRGDYRIPVVEEDTDADGEAGEGDGDADGQEKRS